MELGSWSVFADCLLCHEREVDARLGQLENETVAIEIWGSSIGGLVRVLSVGSVLYHPFRESVKNKCLFLFYAKAVFNFSASLLFTFCQRSMSAFACASSCFSFSFSSVMAALVPDPLVAV